MTTHSPYILSAANNLLYAGILQTNKISGTEKITGKYCYILPSEINALKLVKEENITKSKDLIEKDGDEISTELIDDISNYINKTYSDLFYLEHKVGT